MFIYNYKKSDLNYVYYNFEIYKKVLFFYYLKIKASNSFITMLISENNVALYYKARCLMAFLINKLAI